MRLTAKQFREMQEAKAATAATARSRYKVAPKSDRTLDGIVFASKGEMRRYAILRGQEKLDIIRNLVLQPRFDLVVNGHPIGRYTADFKYEDVTTGETVVEDTKSSGTAREGDYILRRKLAEALYGIRVREILIGRRR